MFYRPESPPALNPGLFLGWRKASCSRRLGNMAAKPCNILLAIIPPQGLIASLSEKPSGNISNR